MSRYLESLERRLLKRCFRDSKTGCLVWEGHTNKRGYGVIGTHRANGKPFTALVHRAAAAVWLGFDLFSSEFVLHTCDNPPCFERSHLIVSDRETNTKEAHERKRYKKPYGESNPNAKLTKKQVTAIRRIYATGHFSQPRLARHFGVSQPMIGYIVRGDNWK